MSLFNKFLDMANIKVNLSDTALKVIAVLTVCVTILVSSVLFIFSRNEDRRSEIIIDCFNVATYSATNEDSKSQVKEPILRFFKSCMEFNGYGSDYSFLTE